MFTFKVFVYTFECNILSSLLFLREKDDFYQFILLINFLDNFFAESFEIFVSYEGFFKLGIMLLIVELSYWQGYVFLFVRVVSGMKFNIYCAYLRF